MLRANIYSLDKLPEEHSRGVHDGIGMVAANLGTEIVATDRRVILPTYTNGNVNPKRVGLSKLDNMVELHVMAVPMQTGLDEQLGLALLGRGLAYVDTSTDSQEIIRSVTAHEVSHSIGFVALGAPQADPNSPNHCVDDGCIMNWRMITFADEVRTKRSFQQFISGESKHKKILKAHKQHDFCTCCKTDLWTKGEENIAKMRHDRLFVHKGIR